MLKCKNMDNVIRQTKSNWNVRRSLTQKSEDGNNTYILIYVSIMYGDTKFVVLHFCTFYTFSGLNEGSKYLFKKEKSRNFTSDVHLIIVYSLKLYKFMSGKHTHTSLIIGKNSLAGWNRFTSLP